MKTLNDAITGMQDGVEGLITWGGFFGLSWYTGIFWPVIACFLFAWAARVAIRKFVVWDFKRLDKKG